MRYVMLKINEEFQIITEDGAKVDVMLVDIDPRRVNQVKLGITAPREIRIFRTELLERGHGVSAP